MNTTEIPQNNTIFGKIIRKELPADIIYEDERCLAFNDINPVAPTHIIIIPKKYITQFSNINPDTDQDLLGHLCCVAKKIGDILGLDKGYRLIINNGQDANQTVYHLHIHLIANRTMHWPPG